MAVNEDNLKKKDLDFVLEVNRKAIEIESEIAEQNEEVISLLKKIDSSQDGNDKKIDKLTEKSDDLSKDFFRMQVLFIGGLLALVTQIVQLFLKK